MWPVVWSMFLVAVMAASAGALRGPGTTCSRVRFLLVRATARGARCSTGGCCRGVAAAAARRGWRRRGSWRCGSTLPGKYAPVGGGRCSPTWPGARCGWDGCEENRSSGCVKRMNHGRKTEREARRAAGASGGLEVVDVETAHLDERLGLLCSVLGEAVRPAGGRPAPRPLDVESCVGPATLGFLTLVGLWWLTFSYGFTAAPHPGWPAASRSRCRCTSRRPSGWCAAAGLGEIVFSPDETLTGARWVMCSRAGPAFLSHRDRRSRGAGAPRRWLAGLRAPVHARAARGRASGLADGPLVLVLLACVAWAVLFGRVAQGARGARGLGQQGGRVRRVPGALPSAAIRRAAQLEQRVGRRGHAVQPAEPDDLAVEVVGLDGARARGARLCHDEPPPRSRPAIGADPEDVAAALARPPRG